MSYYNDELGVAAGAEASQQTTIIRVSTLPNSNFGRAEVPTGSRVKFVATFISNASSLVSIPYPLVGAYQAYKRLNLSSSEQAVKEAFEQRFFDVRATATTLGGAIEVSFTVIQDFATKAALRAQAVSIIESATGYGINTAFLEVTKLAQGISTNRDIDNSPTQRKEQIRQLVSDTSGKILNAGLDAAKDGTKGFFEGLGISTPIAIVGLGIFIWIAVKR